MVSQVIEYFLNLVANEEISQDEFLRLFTEDDDILKQRKEARTILGVEEDSLDFDTMHKNYKALSKDLHPDMPNGDPEAFKRINTAHKILKRELAP